METIAAGALGGFFGSIVMVVLLRMEMFDRPTIIEQVLTRYTRVDTTDGGFGCVCRSVLLVYGTVAGGVFGGVAPFLLRESTVMNWVALGVMFAFVLLVIGNVFWIRIVLGGEETTDMPLSFAVLQVVYGVILGVVVAMMTLF